MYMYIESCSSVALAHLPIVRMTRLDEWLIVARDENPSASILLPLDATIIKKTEL